MKVIQSWDDGLVSDIRLIEILRRHEAKATFCLNPGLYQEDRSFGWMHENREVWRLSHHELFDLYNGFEICSHSMTHPDLTGLSVDQLHWEVHASRQVLEEIFQKPVWAFCYPFNVYNDFVREAVRSAGYRWARGNPHRGHEYPPIDPLEFSPCCHFLDQDFWEKYDQQKKNDAVFFFWGHSCELIDEAMWSDLERMIGRIASDPAVEWVFGADLFA